MISMTWETALVLRCFACLFACLLVFLEGAVVYRMGIIMDDMYCTYNHFNVTYLFWFSKSLTVPSVIVYCLVT